MSRSLCPVLIDRATELAALHDAVQHARTGDGRVVIVSGDAGIGKSRLVGELAAKAESDGLPVLRGACSETDLQVPYLPFIEAIRTYLRRHPADPLPPELRVLFGRSTATFVDPAQQRLQIFEAASRFLDDVAGQTGAVLCIEDVHWSDAGTRDLLDFVVRTLPGSRLLVVATYRADEAGRGHPLLPMVRGWIRRDLATEVALRPLGRDGIAAMLDATIGPHEAALASRLHERSEGNPFVLEEILKTGDLDRAETTLPATVRDAILRRVEQLEPAHVEVLRAAAVLGEPIDDAILVDLLGDGVAAALEASVHEQLLTERPGGTYGWRHALTREAVYHDMAPARRRRLHSDLAGLCDGRRPAVDEVVICGHLVAAGRWDTAVPRCRHAAAAAVSVGAFADAAQLLALCVPHVDSPAEQANLLEEIAELRVQSGTPEAGEAAARQALELRSRSGDSATTAAARRTLALSLWQQARWPEAIEQERRAIADLEPSSPTATLVAALARLGGWTMLGDGDMPAAGRLVARARAIAEAADLDPRLYRADEGQVLVCLGQVDAGLQILDEAWRTGLETAKGRGSGWREAKFMLHHAIAIRNLLGRTSESLAIIDETRAFRTTQDVADVSLAVVEAEARWSHGEVTSAGRIADALDLGRLERVLVPWAQCMRAELRWSAGDLPAAAALARTAMPAHWQPVGQVRIGGLIHLLVEVGDLTAALGLADRLEDLGGLPIDLRLPLIDAAVETRLAAGQRDRAEATAAAAGEAGPDDPRRLRTEARLLLASGAHADAMDHLERAATGFIETGHRQDEWLTRRLIAQALQGQGRHRDAQAVARAIDDDIVAADGVDRPTAATPPTGPVLSAREREVAVLVAQGLRNREIAERLFISERTVENHIHRMLQRSGLRSRAELAARLAD